MLLKLLCIIGRNNLESCGSKSEPNLVIRTAQQSCGIGPASEGSPTACCEDLQNAQGLLARLNGAIIMSHTKEKYCKRKVRGSINSK